MSPKKNEISLAADWGESEPWTQFLSESDPHMALMLQIKSKNMRALEIRQIFII